MNFQDLLHVKLPYAESPTFRSVRHLLTLAALTIGMLGETAKVDPTNIVMIAFMLIGWIVSIVTIASAMRTKLDSLISWKDEQDKWREDHTKLHASHESILASLKTIAEASENRLSRLENNEDRRRDRRSSDRGGD